MRNLTVFSEKKQLRSLDRNHGTNKDASENFSKLPENLSLRHWQGSPFKGMKNS